MSGAFRARPSPFWPRQGRPYDRLTVVAVIVFCLGLVVGIGGMWLAWRVVRKLPPDEADHERTPSPTPDNGPEPDPQA